MPLRCEAGLRPAVGVNRIERGCAPGSGFAQRFQRPKAEPRAEPIIQETADGAAQPRLTSDGIAGGDCSK